MSSKKAPLALPNFKGDVFYLTDEILDEGIEASKNSPRKRMIYPIQRSNSDHVQRLINFLQPGTYIRPHYHPLKHATETIQVIQGSLCFLIFDDNGAVTDGFYLVAGTSGSMIDIVPGVWHNFVVLSEDTVIIEFKKGPYDASTDKVFAEWAPEEETETAQELLKIWENAISEQ
jgi:cupin fold WbuC family metalloprotein